MKKFLAVLMILQSSALSAASTAMEQRIARLLRTTPLIDGHNDLAWEVREKYGARFDAIDLAVDSRKAKSPLHTDMPRLHQGMVGGQFWSVWIPAELQGHDAIVATLEEIDVVKRLIAHYPKDLEPALSADDIVRIHKAGRIASLIGIEGGGQIGHSLAALRQFYALGARYMTLTHSLTTDWADSATDTPRHGGLTPFGVSVIHEMNRLGMLVDISHVAPDTMRAALAASKAPVIFSHSGARALVDHPRNVPDEVLKLLVANGGVVMMVFSPVYTSNAVNRWEAEHEAEKARLSTPPIRGLYIGQPDRIAAALQAWEIAHPRPRATIADIADHLDHLKAVAGAGHIGIGSDFDGISDVPDGMSGVECYPALFAELLRRGWSEQDLAKLAGGNILRVLRQAEAVANSLRALPPPDDDALTPGGADVKE
jgi:membrane dipeptidase